MEVWCLQDERQKSPIEYRLYAPKSEKICLTFNPLKMSQKTDWNPQWEEWHCYRNPLVIYRQDYEKLLLSYFERLYPTKDAFSGETEPHFDVCFDNWVGKEDWEKFISGIEGEFNTFAEEEKTFYEELINWIKMALEYTSIIVVEGNQ